MATTTIMEGTEMILVAMVTTTTIMEVTETTLVEMEMETILETGEIKTIPMEMGAKIIAVMEIGITITRPMEVGVIIITMILMQTVVMETTRVIRTTIKPLEKVITKRSHHLRFLPNNRTTLIKTKVEIKKQ